MTVSIMSSFPRSLSPTPIGERESTGAFLHAR